ncbi:TIGR03862 family flavoprotein [Nitrosomonas communis]|uniref:TIGR03862 family flavoprotein n=1 Tax=Nitrosomonas communis TaxID=44574 RepID=UPI0026F366EB|nr:TIGR03862 family flavoprotein [Nitrosomonas communis]MCO6426861.1 TIGR03862 family flavoprotein [Nitrosomonas communis]
MSTIAIVGGGPAGLMAAEVLSQPGVQVHLYDAMPSVGRKFLLAGIGGLNLTHAEPFDDFVARYGSRQTEITPLLNQFTPQMVREWAHTLGIATFVGSSQRVFPLEMKAAPLLRAWLRRLRAAGVIFHTRHRWHGWNTNRALKFSTPYGEKSVYADAVILALGGGSWAKLGSDGAWLPLLAEQGVTIAPLQPANCGFEVEWSEHFRSRFAAQPVKSVILSFTDASGKHYQKRGELMITATGVEGSLLYAFSAPLRDTLAAYGAVTVYLDLAPDRNLADLVKALAKPRGAKSMANHLRSRIGIAGVKAGLLRESLSAAEYADPARLAAALKTVPIKLIATRPLDEAISTAGGVCFASLDAQLMLKAMPGVFCAGEMLDWEAPTGGYLLTAVLASGRAAGLGALAWLQTRKNLHQSPLRLSSNE